MTAQSPQSSRLPADWHAPEATHLPDDLAKELVRAFIARGALEFAGQHGETLEIDCPFHPRRDYPDRAATSYVDFILQCRECNNMWPLAKWFAAPRTQAGLPPDLIERVNEAIGREVLRNSLAQSVEFRIASEIKPETIRWVWDGRVPAGAVTLLEGPPGLGKSTLACELIARCSKGEPLPGQRKSDGVRRSAFFTTEESVAGTVIPRLKAAGADLNHVLVLDGVNGRHGLRLPEDAEFLTAFAQQEAVSLLVLDPLNGALGEIDPHSEVEVRRMMASLKKLCDEADCTVLALRHHSKSAVRAVYAGLGSIAYSAAARSVLSVGKDPDGKTTCLALSKSNLGHAPTLRYRLAEKPGETVAHIEWLGEAPDVDADSLLAANQDKPRDTGVVVAAMEWMQETLSQGPRPRAEVDASGTAAGFTVNSIRLARERLHAASRKVDGVWILSLPPAGAPAEAPHLLAS